MINVGFLLNFTVEYKGGVNYFKNLFYAVHKYHAEHMNLILFVPSDLDEEYVSLFSSNVKIVKTKILQRKSLIWFLSRVAEKYVRFDPFVYFLLKRNKINCISHSNYVYPFKDIRTINWIPDFQYLYYPKLWKENELNYVTRQHFNWIKRSNLIVVSSHAAKHDLLNHYEQYSDRVEVLHFVSQPESLSNEKVINQKPGVKYFYLPNQFWLHKNHLTVFKAVKLLKDIGVNILVLTTGAGVDYRDSGAHFEMLKQFISKNDLHENIKFLGLVPYGDVLSLMRFSLAIINPSYFEGWSSTVEESKSLNKTIILSDISVHREQDPQKGIYFNPDNEKQLADILNKLWVETENDSLAPDSTKEIDLIERTKLFANTYYSIVKKAFQ